MTNLKFKEGTIYKSNAGNRYECVKVTAKMVTFQQVFSGGDKDTAFSRKVKFDGFGDIYVVVDRRHCEEIGISQNISTGKMSPALMGI